MNIFNGFLSCLSQRTLETPFNCYQKFAQDAIADRSDCSKQLRKQSLHKTTINQNYELLQINQFCLLSFPNCHSYDSNTRCLITIQKFKRSVCHLDLVFIKFDLGATADCDSYTDYLSINGERFCGHYYHNRSLHFSMPDDVAKAVRIRTFRFDGPTLQMRFNGQIGTGK